MTDEQLSYALNCLAVWIADGLINPCDREKREEYTKLLDSVRNRIHTWPFVVKQGTKIVVDLALYNSITARPVRGTFNQSTKHHK